MTDLPDDCPGKTAQKGESFTCTRFHSQGRTCRPCLIDNMIPTPQIRSWKRKEPTDYNQQAFGIITAQTVEAWLK